MAYTEVFRVPGGWAEYVWSRSTAMREGFCNCIPLASVALEANKSEETVRVLVLGLAVREAGKPAEPPPIRHAGVGVIPRRQCLRNEGAEQIWKDDPVLEACLEIAGAGIDDGALSEAVSRELHERDLR